MKPIFTDPEGWATPAELNWLYEQGLKYKTIVEIGSHKGRGSSQALASAVRDGGGYLTCVDPFTVTPDWFVLFKNNVLDKYDRVNLIQLPSVEAARHFKSTSEMVWIDGDHAYASVKDDIATWFPICTKLLCGHDYNDPNVKKAVDEAFGNNVHTFDRSIWYIWIPISKQ